MSATNRSALRRALFPRAPFYAWSFGQIVATPLLWALLMVLTAFVLVALAVLRPSELLMFALFVVAEFYAGRFLVRRYADELRADIEATLRTEMTKTAPRPEPAKNVRREESVSA